MHIAKVSNHGIPYLQLMESYSIKERGITKNKKRSLKNLGPLSRFDDGQPDFLKRLRASFKEGRPLIAELEKFIDQAPARKITINFSLDSNDEVFSSPKNIGYFLLDSLYNTLGINDVLRKAKSLSNIQYDLNGLVKLLVFSRIFSPDSKCSTWKARDFYLFDIVKSRSQIEIYRVLDVLNEQAERIQKRINHKILGGIGRNKKICFYDVTNYWFEIDDNDEDVFDASGNFLKEGLRKSGPSKAKTRKPIVQMGLFIDDNGIPIAYRLFPGNHIDQTTLRPTLKKSINKMDFEKVIIVADGGLNSGKNLAYILSCGNGYIVSKSAKGSDKKTKNWILDDEGYEWNSKRTFKLKSMIRQRVIKDEDGNDQEIKEKLISFWSEKQYAYALHENQKFIEYLERVIAFPDKLKDKQSKVQKYLKRQKVVKRTGEIVETVSVLSIDQEKVQQDLALMGYYTLMTSELNMDDREVIDKYHGLSRIEDSFRVMKSDLEGRPVYVRSKEHINGHFLVCFIALTLLRIIQFQILKSSNEQRNCTRKWRMGLSADRIKRALSEFKADLLPGGYYRVTRADKDLERIFQAFGVDPMLRLPTGSELRRVKQDIDRAVVG